MAYGGVKEYFLAVFIPTEKEQYSQLHAKEKVPLRVRWHPESNWKQRKRWKKIFYRESNLDTQAINLLPLY
jgi:hypothetical protein